MVKASDWTMPAAWSGTGDYKHAARAALIGAKFKITTAPGHGTEIETVVALGNGE